MKKTPSPASAAANADTRLLGVRFQMIKEFGWFVLVYHLPIMLLTCIVIVLMSIAQNSFVGVPFGILAIGLGVALICDATNPDSRLVRAHNNWKIHCLAGTGAVHRIDARGRLLSSRIPPTAAPAIPVAPPIPQPPAWNVKILPASLNRPSRPDDLLPPGWKKKP